MMKVIKFAALGSLVTVFLLIGCSSDKPTKSDRQPTALTITLLKTSLAETVQKVTLEVARNEQIIRRDTSAVTDGHFSFPSFDLDAGDVTFAVNGLDSQNRVVYSGQTTVTIEPGHDNTVSLQLLPAVPMVKLSPYWSQTQIGSKFVSRLELYNIAKFRSGDFQIAFNPAVIRFDSLQPSNVAWGALTDTASVIENQLLIDVSRQGNNDVVPLNSPALINLWFTALSAGTTTLTLSTDRMVDNVGTIAELGSSSFVADGQTISIRQVFEYGTIMGNIRNAFNDEPLDSVDVGVTGPVQRSVKTDSEGIFLIAELPYGAYTVVASKIGYIQTIRTVQLLEPTFIIDLPLTPLPDSNQYRAVLTWGAEPNDLDIHLHTLDSEIYWGSMGSIDTVPYALLDVDNRDGYGPETITIDKLLDTCKFSVHNFSSTPGITVSDAHIDFYRGTHLIRSFDVPTTGDGDWWHVFDLTPAGLIIERNTIIDYNPGTGERSSRLAKPVPK